MRPLTFALTCVVALLAAVGGHGWAVAQEKPAPPNILFIMADDK